MIRTCAASPSTLTRIGAVAHRPGAPATTDNVQTLQRNVYRTCAPPNLAAAISATWIDRPRK